MFILRRTGFGGHGPPPDRGRMRTRRLALVVLALAAMGLEGCASWKCGSGCGGGWFRNNRITRAFRRDVVVTDSCGEPGMIMPAAPIVAAPAVIPAPAVVAPAEPAGLEPIPPASEAQPTTKQGRASPNQRTLYETVKPSGGTTASRREADSPPPPRAAQQGDDPLIDLPPLSAAVARPAEELEPPVHPAAGSLNVATGLGLQEPRELPPKPVALPLSMTEGIARFKVVKPQIAGGSAPTESGWAFLVEKGYHTVLDLRPTSEAGTGDTAAAHRAGLRYIILPVTPETLDETLLHRFSEELGQTGNHPLYFFDNDGSRAAALWYLHQVVVDHVDEATAAKEVEELGPRDGRLWQAATTLLDSRERPRAEPPVTAPSSIVPKPAVVPEAADPGRAAFAPVAPITPVAVLTPINPDASDAADSTAWQPYTAMLVTGLSGSLAFFGRNALSHLGTRRANHLAGPRSRKSLPRA